MTHRDLLPRRTFLIDAARIAAAGFLTFELHLLAGCARDSLDGDAAFAHLTTVEARALRAFASRILPSVDGAPGADEAQAAYFVDRAIAMPFFAGSVALIRGGLADLDARARAATSRENFASASEAQQIAIMHAIESTPFFAGVRTLVIIGTLADPSYGGNRDGVGWALLGLEHRPTFTAPFGWYDAHMSSAPSTGALS